MNDSVDLVPKTIPKVSGLTKYSLYKNNYYHILMFMFYKTFGRVLFQQGHEYLKIIKRDFFQSQSS